MLKRDRENKKKAQRVGKCKNIVREGDKMQRSDRGSRVILRRDRENLKMEKDDSEYKKCKES